MGVEERTVKKGVEERRIKIGGCSFSLMRISSHHVDPTSLIKGYKVKKFSWLGILPINRQFLL